MDNEEQMHRTPRAAAVAGCAEGGSEGGSGEGGEAFGHSVMPRGVLDALELEVGVAVVGAGRVDAVLIGDDLPELGADLVACASHIPSAIDTDIETEKRGARGGEPQKNRCHIGTRPSLPRPPLLSL